MARPARWLAGYALADAGPGEVLDITVDIPARAFQHWSAEHHTWRAEEGAFTVLAGRSAADLPLSGTTLLGTRAPVQPGLVGERSPIML
ncbi:fibronectin type III-like domain-contianing protein [Streptosporangium album]|uniref:fibronectin type III-like domain-contianing protein n=1 Tax=Streptosporangium album TaxID=47479 RepID=UPI0028A600F7|nr:fibronectin type III-like domain-contianing protein [Streptosporangium album]